MHQSENEKGLGVIREEHDVIVGVAGLCNLSVHFLVKMGLFSLPAVCVASTAVVIVSVKINRMHLETVIKHSYATVIE